MDRQRHVSGDDALARLRDELGLHERVPVIDEFHGVGYAISDQFGPVAMICAHDSANARTHELAVSAEQQLPPDFEAMLANINLVLAGPWN